MTESTSAGADGRDRIEIHGIRAFGRHGVYAHERRDGQHFVIDVTLERELDTPARSDALGDTIDYGTLAQQVVEAVAKTRFDLIEALAGHLADLALTDPSVDAVTVRVAKPEAPVTVEVDAIAVVLRREQSR